VPGVGACSICYTLTKCSRYCLMFWLPYFLKTAVGMGQQQAATVASLLDLTGVPGAILMGVACDRFYGGAALKAAMHSCAITGLCFCLWATACAAGAASTAVHVTAILTIGFFVAGPGGVLGASARGLVGYAGRAKEGALVAAVAGLVNGSGSVGAVVQGLLTTQILEYSGWAGLFGARERSPLPPYEAPNHASRLTCSHSPSRSPSFITHTHAFCCGHHHASVNRISPIVSANVAPPSQSGWRWWVRPCHSRPPSPSKPPRCARKPPNHLIRLGDSIVHEGRQAPGRRSSFAARVHTRSCSPLAFTVSYACRLAAILGTD